MKLSTGLNQFFVHYLPHIKGSSEKTIHAYRDTYRLFLPFAADYHHIKVTSLRIEHLTVELIIAFLNHLEEDRKNTARTRPAAGGHQITGQNDPLHFSSDRRP